MADGSKEDEGQRSITRPKHSRIRIEATLSLRQPPMYLSVFGGEVLEAMP